MLVTFGGVYDLRKARFMQRSNTNGQFKDLQLRFDGNLIQEVWETIRLGEQLGVEIAVLRHAQC